MINKFLINQYPFIPFPYFITTMLCTALITSFAYIHCQSLIVLYALIFASIIFFITKHVTALCFCLASLLAAGIIYYRFDTIQNEFKQNKQYLYQPITLYGTIVSKQNSLLDFEQTAIVLEISAIKTKHKFDSLKKKIYIMGSYKKMKKLTEGQHIKISNITLQQPTDDTDFTRYMLKENLWATSFISAQPIYIFNQKHLSHARYYLEKIRKLLSESALQLFAPLFLGQKDSTKETIAMRHQSTYLGIAHHMARSGIHLIAILGLILLLLHFARIPYNMQLIITTFIAYYYLQISFLSTSFLRAFCMMLIQMLCKTHQYMYSSMHALNMTALLIIMHNPYYPSFLDFQLSFGITAAVIWLFQIKKNQTIAFNKTHEIEFLTK